MSSLRTLALATALSCAAAAAPAVGAELGDPTRPPELAGGPALPEVVDPEAPLPLHLSSTLLARGRSLAVINDELLTTGDEVGGYRIKRIGRRGVLLERGSVVFELGLDTRAVTPPPLSSAAERGEP